MISIPYHCLVCRLSTLIISKEVHVDWLIIIIIIDNISKGLYPLGTRSIIFNNYFSIRLFIATRGRLTLKPWPSHDWMARRWTFFNDSISLPQHLHHQHQQLLHSSSSHFILIICCLFNKNTQHWHLAFYFLCTESWSTLLEPLRVAHEKLLSAISNLNLTKIFSCLVFNYDLMTTNDREIFVLAS